MGPSKTNCSNAPPKNKENQLSHPNSWEVVREGCYMTEPTLSKGGSTQKEDKARPFLMGLTICQGVHTSAADLCSLFTSGLGITEPRVLGALFALTLLCWAVLGPCD